MRAHSPDPSPDPGPDPSPDSPPDPSPEPSRRGQPDVGIVDLPPDSPTRGIPVEDPGPVQRPL